MLSSARHKMETGSGSGHSCPWLQCAPRDLDSAPAMQCCSAYDESHELVSVSSAWSSYTGERMVQPASSMTRVCMASGVDIAPIMRGRGPAVALALAAALLCLGTSAQAARALQQDRVCRYACAIGLVCIDGFCQEADNPAVVNLSTPAAGPSAAVPASGEVALVGAVQLPEGPLSCRRARLSKQLNHFGSMATAFPSTCNWGAEPLLCVAAGWRPEAAAAGAASKCAPGEHHIGPLA